MAEAKKNHVLIKICPWIGGGIGFIINKAMGGSVLGTFVLAGIGGGLGFIVATAIVQFIQPKSSEG